MKDLHTVDTRVGRRHRVVRIDEVIWRLGSAAGPDFRVAVRAQGVVFLRLGLALTDLVRFVQRRRGRTASAHLSVPVAIRLQSHGICFHESWHMIARGNEETRYTDIYIYIFTSNRVSVLTRMLTVLEIFRSESDLSRYIYNVAHTVVRKSPDMPIFPILNYNISRKFLHSTLKNLFVTYVDGNMRRVLTYPIYRNICIAVYIYRVRDQVTPISRTRSTRYANFSQF